MRQVVSPKQFALNREESISIIYCIFGGGRGRIMLIWVNEVARRTTSDVSHNQLFVTKLRFNLKEA